MNKLPVVYRAVVSIAFVLASACSGGGSGPVTGDAGNTPDAGVDAGSGVCSTNAQCRLGDICSDGVCIAACVSDSDCPGSTCDVHTGECLTPDAGTDAGTELDAGSGADAGTGPASDAGSYFPDGGFPQVVNGGGPVLASPHFVVIFFTGDNDPQSSVADMTAFYQGLGSSSYWAALSEYGIGAPTVSVITTPPPWTGSTATIDDSDTGSQLDTWLQGMIDNGTSGTPANVVNETLYIINYPLGVAVTMDGNSCSDFGGYHSDLQLANGDTVAYAVVPRCTGASMGFDTDLQSLTTSASHDFVESATDPYFDFNEAWGQADDAHIFWDEANYGSELGDMCQNDLEAYYQFSDFGYTVQRFWSNASVVAGHDPCVPLLPGEVFFNAVAELPDTGAFDNYQGGNYRVSSVNIAVGRTGTVNLDFYSDGDTGGPWQVQVFDFDQAYQSMPTLLEFTLPACGSTSASPSCTALAEGGQLPLTIKVDAAGNPNTDGQPANTELFMVQVTLGTGDNAIQHYWWGVVTN